MQQTEIPQLLYNIMNRHITKFIEASLHFLLNYPLCSYISY